MRGPRHVLALAASLAVLAGPAHAAELLVHNTPGIAGLAAAARAWAEEAGHQVNMIPIGGAESAGDRADVIVTDVATARALDAEGRLWSLSVPEDGPPPAPLFNGSWQRGTGEEVALAALALPARLPALHVDRARLAARGLELPTVPDWRAVAQFAAALNDPVGDVHGLCVDPRYPHATIVRAMLAAAGQPWAEPDAGPLAGPDWLDAARGYAQMLAESGPANAARLLDTEFDELLGAGRCAMALAPWDLAHEQEMTTYPVPGAAAFLDDAMPVVAVVAGTGQEALASECAWALARAGNLAWGGKVGAVLLRPQSVPVRSWPAIEAMLRQPAPPGLQRGGWDAVDAAAQAPLADLVDGLLPATAALAAAVEGLPAASS